MGIRGLCSRYGVCILIIFATLNTFAEQGEHLPDLLGSDHSNEAATSSETDETGGIGVPFSCRRANTTQLNAVNAGNRKTREFLRRCAAATNSSKWCAQLIRPNPASLPVFRCTYGAKLPHQLINPDESTWPNAFKAVKLVQSLESGGIQPCLIYNWWRPEPYNANVSGAPGRHPFGTSVDVRFCTMNDMERAFRQLCAWRSQGRLQAVGYYGSTGLHFGIDDSIPNTWGKDCPGQ